MNSPGKSRHGHSRSALERWSKVVVDWTGGTWAFALAVCVVLAWLLTGPLFRFSDTWQLVINTSTTIITFLMVFLIQRAQNSDSLAVHLKLNEIVAAMQAASNRLVDVEDLSEEELKTLHTYYERLAESAKRDHSLFKSHSVDEAERAHRNKIRKFQS